MILPSIIRKRLTRQNLLRCIILWISKAIFTLAILNIYMGSQMTVHHSRRPWEKEGSRLSLVHLMSHQRSQSSIDIATKLKNNSTILQIDSNNNMSSITSTADNHNNIVDNNVGVMITPSLADGTLQGKE
jgi:hypothetical protein